MPDQLYHWHEGQRINLLYVDSFSYQSSRGTVRSFRYFCPSCFRYMSRTLELW